VKTPASALSLLVSAATFGAFAPLACGSPPDAVVPTGVGSASASASAAPSHAVADVEDVPKVRLPDDTRPIDETLEIRIVPSDERFSGIAEITVEVGRARSVIWLHGRDLHVSRATVTPDGGAAIDATWEQKHHSGMGSLTMARAIPAGRAKVRIEYDAPLAKALKGLYRAKQAGESYAFTQFEALGARQAFPCFDEPGFKIPFSITLVVPSGAQAIANTKESPAVADGAMKRVKFAPTLPLPSYLVAFAVGPLDIVPVADIPPNAVRKRPLQLRGVAAKGRGPEMAYALAHTGEILTKLEEYFGIEYPYDKLDILAVPDKDGAMENAGAVTFREYLVLMDEKTAPIGQKRAFAGVMAHELAHMWFGDLVTMNWWDDIWLNEAFATWMGNKAADMWDPKLKMDVSLLGGVQGAMGTDSLVAARAIRQPILTTHDIENAFDGITYQKGGGVLGMFERWIGHEAFQRGVHNYLDGHRFGSAGADDFLAALSTAAGKDVKAPFHTFLDQPGVPFVEVEMKCDAGVAPRAHMKQSRFFPIGSSGDAAHTWQIPVCARYGVGKETKEACTLLTEKEGDLTIPGAACPDWIFPNAHAAGYYRFSLASADLDKLRKGGVAALKTREKIAFGNSLRAGYNRGTVPFADALGAASTLAGDENAQVAGESMGYVSSAREWFTKDPKDAPLRAKVEAYGRSLYAKAYAHLGWTRAKGEDDDAMTLRQSVISFLAFTARDPAVRAEAKKRGLAYVKDGAIHRDAVDANLAGIALAVAGEEADAKLFDSLVAQLGKTVDDELRGRLLWAIGSAKDPALAARARDLALDPSLRTNEVMSTLWAQIGALETRDATWEWMKSHYDALTARISSHHGGARVIGAGGNFCDEAHAADVDAFFAKRADGIEGGPRVLASTLEGIRLCVARRAAQEPSARTTFGKR
jgi:alanyl aminopeptidase